MGSCANDDLTGGDLGWGGRCFGMGTGILGDRSVLVVLTR